MPTLTPLVATSLILMAAVPSHAAQSPVPPITSASTPSAQAIRLIGAASISATATDLSGLTNTLPSGVPHNRLASMGSGIASTNAPDRYLMVADRGPKDGADPYLCRFHEFEIVIDASPDAREPVGMKLISTTLLASAEGPLTGSAAAIAPTDAAGERFDPEALRLMPDGHTLIIADEYGPGIGLFARDCGTRLRSLPVPRGFEVAQPHADAKEELAANTPPRGRGGRVPNNGIEGMDLSADGTSVFGLMQGPLMQDDGKQGRICRLVQISTVESESAAAAPARQFGYTLEKAGLGTSELLTLDEHRFLVLERDGLGGTDARVKRIYLIDTRGSTDLSRFPAMPGGGLPNGASPVKKRLLIDLLDPAFMLAGPSFPAKVEGLCWGPTLASGSRVLLVTTDNDFKDDEASWVWAFEVPQEALAQ